MRVTILKRMVQAKSGPGRTSPNQENLPRFMGKTGSIYQNFPVLYLPAYGDTAPKS